jgi:arsenate reductase
MITIYGIKNCNTMQKAFDWLNEQGIAYSFHDYKKEGIEETKLLTWLDKTTLKELVNAKGTTYRNLTDTQKKALENPKKAIPIIQQNTSVIKRPVLEYKNQLLLGFDAESWSSILHHV